MKINFQCLFFDTLGEEDDTSYNDEITSRTQFPESWLWTDIKLPAACLKEHQNGESI